MCIRALDLKSENRYHEVNFSKPHFFKLTSECQDSRCQLLLCTTYLGKGTVRGTIFLLAFNQNLNWIRNTLKAEIMIFISESSSGIENLAQFVLNW